MNKHVRLPTLPNSRESHVARNINKRAKRANKPNPREDRNFGRNHRAEIIPFHDSESDRPTTRKKRVELLPRNVAQEDYVDTLLDESKHVVFAMGPAGCGKTLLATQYAIQALQSGDFTKIIITRPAVSVDEQHGFLPGTLVEKMAPWVLPIMDVFKEHYTPAQVEKMVLDEVIEIAPLAYMRGRTFKNAIVLFDEAQNSNINQMKMVLTRIGENSRMIVTGDIKQADRGFEENGLKDFVERLSRRGSDAIAICEFETGDVERHPIIEEILNLYGDN
ncbi:MAG: PhoH family protein [Verrucomicrobiaceae bacterium]|nr:MAG: PhoH family protein [Verrucomicrobiaceae bacterium]